MFHFVYTTRNLTNGKMYVGKHSTSVLSDGYLGSGTALKRAIKKHGRENFEREIHEFFETAEIAFEAEQALVTQELVKDPRFYNLTLGGTGNGVMGVNGREKVSQLMKINNPMFRPEVVAKFRRKRPDQSAVASKRNAEYWLTRRKPELRIVCEFCHVEFRTRNSQRRFCGGSCRTRFLNNQRKSPG